MFNNSRDHEVYQDESSFSRVSNLDADFSFSKLGYGSFFLDDPDPVNLSPDPQPYQLLAHEKLAGNESGEMSRINGGMNEA